MKPRTAGLLLGLLLAALAWFGNQQRVDTFTVQAFPDLLTLFAVPVGLYLALRQWDRRQPGLDLGRLRRAGWTIVNTSAAVFALAVALLTSERIAADSESITVAFITALVTAAGIGYVSVEVWARLIVRVRHT